MRLAVIPARGGSKRIPRKSIKPFAGRPMLAYPVAAARESGCFDAVIVSTDDDELAQIALAAGAEVPFRRPPALANDHAATAPVIAHAIEAMQTAGHEPRVVACLYPAAVFITAQHLRQAVSLLEGGGLDFVVSVTDFAAPVERRLAVDAEGRVSMVQPEHLLTRTQDLPVSYHDAGQFYVATPQAWLEQRPVFGPATAAVMLERKRVVDIDSPDDWALAEALFRALQDEP